jgi:signal transduction histidine kinase
LVREEKGCKIGVTNDGPSINPDEQDRLFKKFEQLKRPTGGDGYKGTGLGLVLCKEMVELHKGKIWLESAPDEGVSFFFTLPVSQ